MGQFGTSITAHLHSETQTGKIKSAPDSSYRARKRLTANARNQMTTTAEIVIFGKLNSAE